jgi:pSer/pThr/pTyr-binding forkhead associated (FHA) protein
MRDSPHPPGAIGDVAIQLLDPSSGRPINSWTFKEQAEITIGRSPDQDVAISDPYVSRNHANLVHRDGRWHLVSLGRNGIVVANQLVKEQVISRELLFRLGVEGPTLKFCEDSDSNRVDIGATISFSAEMNPMFQLDETRLQREVSEIADGDYFQNLQRKAKEMRTQRKVD